LVLAVILQLLCVFFFQAEDGIRDATVTGVQTCALPIFDAYPVPAMTGTRPPDVWTASSITRRRSASSRRMNSPLVPATTRPCAQIGRASCRERRERGEGAGTRDKR